MDKKQQLKQKAEELIAGAETAVRKLNEGEQAEFEEVLSIFDLLCHAGTGKCMSGRFASVNSLKGRGAVVGVGTAFHGKAAATFDRDPEGFKKACLESGGTEISLGDVGFSFPLFGELTVQLKFYRADEDFPASVTLLWDENLLRYVYYETVFYMAGFLLGSVLQQMEKTVAICAAMG